MSYFEMVRLNFLTLSINYFVDVKVYNETPLHYIRCRGARLSDYDGDEKLAYMKGVEEPVVCYGGGAGIKFEEFYLNFIKIEEER